MFKRLFNYFTRLELFLWLGSVSATVISYVAFGGDGALTLIASLIGITSLILNAKGNPIGQVLMLLFSAMYGVISYSFAYYGEMITYLGLTAPMALLALVSWLRHPYNGNRSEVAVNRIRKGEVPLMLALTAAVTLIFYFILAALGTSSLIISTVSVTTSFVAVYLTFRRSPYFALAYAANDIVLIVLWIIASVYDSSYVSVAVCFLSFLVNDIYGFFSWLKMEKRQHKL